jgi:hypothetical protein
VTTLSYFQDSTYKAWVVYLRVPVSPYPLKLNQLAFKALILSLRIPPKLHKAYSEQQFVENEQTMICVYFSAYLGPFAKVLAQALPKCCRGQSSHARTYRILLEKLKKIGPAAPRNQFFPEEH